MTLTVGELCAGYGGLGVAVEHVFNARLAWVSEYEDAPSKILRHHFPHVPNHGDMTKINWYEVEPVDIISGGTPCQDLSGAGRRRGMTEGTRSNLWVQMREAIAIIRPRYVVWENVRGAYSATADSEVEFCPGCMGNPGDRKHLLRALGRVIGDLSDLGYDCEWRGIRASDVGAPHKRFRVFILATHRDGGRSGWGSAIPGDGQGQEPDASPVRPAGRPGESRAVGPAAAGDTERGRSGQISGRDGRGTAEENRPGVPDEPAGHDHGRGSDGAPADDDGQGLAVRGDQRRTPGAVEGSGAAAVGNRERPADAQSFGGDEFPAAAGGEGHVQAGRRGGRESVADADSVGRSQGRAEQSGVEGGQDPVRHGDAPASDPRGHAVGEHAGKSSVEETGPEGRHGSGDPGRKRSAGKRGPAVADTVGEPGDERRVATPGKAEGGRASGVPVRHYGTRFTAYTKSIGRGVRGPFDFIPTSGKSDVPVDQDPASTGAPGPSEINWGEYEPAIRRWEAVLGRPAPAPTEPSGRNGNHRLSPRFAEWMMGMPDGWICDVPGVGRNDALKAAGNGVVPQQAAAALSDMLRYSLMV